MVKEENIRAKLDLQVGLRKFKEDAMKQGWEEDEVQEKISEVFVSKFWIVNVIVFVPCRQKCTQN